MCGDADGVAGAGIGVGMDGSGVPAGSGGSTKADIASGDADGAEVGSVAGAGSGAA